MTPKTMKDVFKEAAAYQNTKLKCGVMDREEGEALGFEAARAHGIYKKSVVDIQKSFDTGAVTDEADIHRQLLIAKVTYDTSIQVLNSVSKNATVAYGKKRDNER